jgi:hypothetical protein
MPHFKQEKERLCVRARGHRRKLPRDLCAAATFLHRDFVRHDQSPTVDVQSRRSH